MQVYRSETEKPVEQFVSDLFREAKDRGFMIHNEDKMENSVSMGSRSLKILICI